MQRYCQVSFIVIILVLFVLPASVEVTREAVAAVEMNMSGQNNENINIIHFYCVYVHYNKYYDTLYNYIIFISQSMIYQHTRVF